MIEQAIEQAIVCVRSQHAKRGRGRFAGPDTYVAVQVVPAGVEPLVRLDRTAAQRRGIRIEYFGEGYSRHRGSRSRLGRALAAARAFAEQRCEN